ncbi:hypothetical protein EMIT0P74_20151 [Pseudomonas sp. IT-P74]
MTSNTLSAHDPVIDTQPSRNVRGLAESPFAAFTTPVEPGISHENENRPLDRQPLRRRRRQHGHAVLPQRTGRNVPDEPLPR